LWHTALGRERLWEVLVVTRRVWTLALVLLLVAATLAARAARVGDRNAYLDAARRWTKAVCRAAGQEARRERERSA
jgi:hypothetical protein